MPRNITTEYTPLVLWFSGWTIHKKVDKRSPLKLTRLLSNLHYFYTPTFQVTNSSTTAFILINYSFILQHLLSINVVYPIICEPTSPVTSNTTTNHSNHQNNSLITLTKHVCKLLNLRFFPHVLTLGRRNLTKIRAVSIIALAVNQEVTWTSL